MKITRITKQERRDRYNIFVDGKFCAALSAELLLEARIAEGDDLAPGQLDPFLDRDAVGKVVARAFRYLAQRPHSEHELRIKLTRKEVEPDLVEEAFVRLRERGYLDDAAFARQWVEERGIDRGPRLLSAELRRKGVADEVIEQVVVNDETEQVAAARDLSAKRLARLSGESPATVRRRLSDHLARGGYSYDVIRRALDELTSATTN